MGGWGRKTEWWAGEADGGVRGDETKDPHNRFWRLEALPGINQQRHVSPPLLPEGGAGEAGTQY